MKKFILILLSLCLSATIGFAADTAVPSMTEDTTPSSDDLVYTVNEPGGVAGDRKVTLENLFKSSWWFRSLSDPNADRIVFWDESSGAGGAIGFLTVGTGLTISGTTITATGSGDMLKSTYDSNDDGVFALAQGGLGVALSDPNANRILGWDDTDNANVYMVIGSGLTYTAATNTLTATGTGDVTDVGPGYSTGAAFTDGVVSTGTTMFVWEGTTSDGNEFSVEAPAADPGADIVFTFPAETGTGMIGPAGLAADNVLIRTDGTGNKVQATGITVADTSNNMSGVGTIDSGAITSTGAVKGTSVVLEGGANDTTLVAGTPAAAISYTLPSNTGTEGQYLQLGAANALQWGDPAGSGDVTAIGNFDSGAAFTLGDTQNGILYFEGSTANDFEIALTAANATADRTITLPDETGTVMLGPAGLGTDNRLMKTDGTGNLVQITGIAVDDSNNVSGVGTIGSGAITTSGNIIIGADPADAGTGIRMSNNTGIYFEDTEGTGEVAALVVDASEAVLIGSSGADSVTITPNTTVSGTLSVTGALAANGGITMGTGDGFTVNSVNLLSGDELDGTKIKDADYGDVTISAGGAWAVEDDSHAHGSTTITLASTNLTDTASIAMLADNEAVTGNWSFGNADTDTLTLRSLLVGGNSRAIWIAGSAPTPTYATGTNELYVAGDVETAGTVYASAFNGGTGTDGSRAITMNSNTTFTPSGNQLYFLNNVVKVSENGTERDIVTPADTVTWTGATHSFAGVTSMILPTAAPDANGEIAINNTSEQFQVYINSGLKTFDFSSDSSGYVLKSDGSGNFTLQADATGGSPTLNSVANPTGDTTIAMDASEEVNFQYTGNYTTGTQFLVQQLTGNPSGGVLFEVRAADSDSVLARFGDGTNYLQVSQAGNVSHAGTSVFTAPRVATSIAPSAADGATLGTSALEFSDLYLADGGVIYFQNDQSVYLTPSAGTLTLTGAFVSSGAHTPSVANGAALGSATAEWADLFLHDGAVIYGQADQSATLTSSASLWTANNFSVTTQFKVPSSDADPTATAGYLRHDSTITNFTNGGLVYYNGAAIKQVVDMTTATAQACSDDQVVAYDADNDLWYCKNDATGAGASGTVTTVKEADTQVGGADIVTLDFGAGFDVAESPDTEVQITFDPTEVTVWDLGGATSFELPNGTNPTVDATGEIAIDTDGANESGDLTLRVFDGTNTVALARKLECINVTVVKPQDLADSVRDRFPVWNNNTGMTFTITEIKAWSDTDNTTLAVEVVTATNWGSPATVDALECATDGTGVYTDTQTTITDATIAHDETITLDFDDTDDPGVVQVTICGWYNGAVD